MSNVVITTSRNISFPVTNAVDALIAECWSKGFPYIEYYDAALLRGIPLVTIGVYAEECARLELQMEDYFVNHLVAQHEHAFNL